MLLGSQGWVASGSPDDRPPRGPRSPGGVVRQTHHPQEGHAVQGGQPRGAHCARNLLSQLASCRAAPAQNWLRCFSGKWASGPWRVPAVRSPCLPLFFCQQQSLSQFCCRAALQMANWLNRRVCGQTWVSWYHLGGTNLFSVKKTLVQTIVWKSEGKCY